MTARRSSPQSRRDCTRRARASTLLVVLVALLGGCGRDRVAVVDDRSWDPVAGEPRRPQAPSSPQRALREHVVVRGDTLHAIGFRHGVTVESLARWNGLAPPYTIYPGQRLRIESAPPSAPPAGRVAGSAAPPRSAPRDTRDTRRFERTPDGAEVAAVDSAPPARVEALPAPRRAPPAAAPVAPRDVQPDPAPGTPPIAVPPAPPEVGEDLAAPSEPRAETLRAAAAAPPPVATPTPSAAATPSVSIPPAPTRASGGVSWRWPARGNVTSGFRAGDPARQGIDIRGQEGDPVHAAADGEVVYSGNGLLGYGELVIVSHGQGFLSAYGYNRKRLVAEGERVRAGQVIAEMGRRGGTLDLLHFEIRRDGRPVDPLAFLPPR